MLIRKCPFIANLKGLDSVNPEGCLFCKSVKIRISPIRKSLIISIQSLPTSSIRKCLWPKPKKFFLANPDCFRFLILISLIWKGLDSTDPEWCLFCISVKVSISPIRKSLIMPIQKDPDIINPEFIFSPTRIVPVLPIGGACFCQSGRSFFR